MIQALRDGIRRVNDAPAILFGVWLLMLGVSLPLTAAEVAVTAGASVGSSNAAEVLLNRTGIKPFLVMVEGLLGPIWGGNGILRASRFVVWLFVLGGIVDRLARDRATRTDGFFAASGVYFFRFVPLAVAWGLVSAAIGFSFRPLMRPPSGPAMWALLILNSAVRLTFNYSVVRTVVEDRRSAIGSIGATARFIIANIGTVAGIAIVVGIVGNLFTFATNYVMFTQQAGDWSRFVTAQGFAIVGTWITLVGRASEISLFQSKLAHAGYVARPQAAWPESPSAEAITASGRARSSV